MEAIRLRRPDRPHIHIKIPIYGVSKYQRLFWEAPKTRTIAYWAWQFVIVGLDILWCWGASCGRQACGFWNLAVFARLYCWLRTKQSQLGRLPCRALSCHFGMLRTSELSSAPWWPHSSEAWSVTNWFNEACNLTKKRNKHVESSLRSLPTKTPAKDVVR